MHDRRNCRESAFLLVLILVGVFFACHTPRNHAEASMPCGKQGHDNAGTAGDLCFFNVHGEVLAARIRLFITDPVVANRLPGVSFDSNVVPTSQRYEGGGMVSGQSIRFTMRSGTKILADQMWATDFPARVSRDYLGFHPPNVNISGWLEKFLRAGGFNQEDLVKLSRSRIPEVRLSAVQVVQDQMALAEVAIQEGNASDLKMTLKSRYVSFETAVSHTIGSSAVQKITDQALLAKVAAEALDDYVADMARERLAKVRASKQ